MRIYLQILYVFLYGITEQNCAKMKNVRNNIVHKSNDEIEFITNKLFHLFGIKNFQNSNDNQYLLKVYYKLRNIHETNMEIYEMTQLLFDENEEVANSALNVIDIINNIDDNEIENINYNLVIDNTLVNITKLSSHLMSKSEPLEDKFTKDTIKNDESIGSPTFLDEFVKKIDNLTLEDFIDKKIDSLNSTTQFLKKYYDLKSWRKLIFEINKFC